MKFNDLMSILQASVSPVILISGVGLLILSMTNRFGQVANRSRLVRDELRNAPENERKGLDAQIAILIRRAQLLRTAITYTTVSVLLAAVLVIASFLTALLQLEVVYVIAVLFMLCLVSLIIGLVAFLRDINLSLEALKLELEPNDREKQ